MKSFIWVVVFCQVLPMGRVYNYAEAVDCGLRSLVGPPSGSRFLGGEDAVEGAWPWQVVIFSYGQPVMGGAILSPEWVLTSASFFILTPNRNLYIVQAGFIALSQPGDHVQRRSIGEIKAHPSHSITTSDSDVALLRLDSPLIFNDYVQPICIPLGEYEENALKSNKCIMTGWSRLYQGDQTLLAAPVPKKDRLRVGRNMVLINSSTCDQSFGGKKEITENMICAYRVAAGNDSNQCDVGGPLQCYSDVSQRFFLLGLGSIGKWYGKPHTNGVYARVSRFATWIGETVNLDLSPTTTPTPSGGSKSSTSVVLVLLCGALLLLGV